LYFIYFTQVKSIGTLSGPLAEVRQKRLNGSGDKKMDDVDKWLLARKHCRWSRPVSWLVRRATPSRAWAQWLVVALRGNLLPRTSQLRDSSRIARDSHPADAGFSSTDNIVKVLIKKA
jgi:hypothetical protein